MKDESLSMVKYFIEMDSSALDFHKNENEAIPLIYYCVEYDTPNKSEFSIDQCKCSNIKNHHDIMEYLIRRTALKNPLDSQIGGLLAKVVDENGEEERLLESLIDHFGEKAMWKTIHKALASIENVPFLHEVIRCLPKYFNTVCALFPDSVFVRDCQKRLPIHVALEGGYLNWSSELVSLINANRSSLHEMDPVTKWPPFALAAKKDSCDLSTIFFLLQRHPGHIEPYCVDRRRSKKRKREKTVDFDHI